MNVIGIVGLGFVGKAVHLGFDNSKNEIFAVDTKLGTTIDQLIEKKPDVVFVCLPTPSGENSTINTSIVENAIQELEDKRGDLDFLIVLKSTVVPSVLTKIKLKTKHFVYNPEFLREASAGLDFLYPEFMVFGGEFEECKRLARIYNRYSQCVCDVPIFIVSHEEAALVKYAINSYLAMKVTFFNQLKDLTENVENASYEIVRQVIGEDSRIGSSHTQVPGNDDRRGFGGSCFSKDIPALIHESQIHGAELTLLKEAWNANVNYRNGYVDLLEREIEQNISFNEIK